MAGDPVTYPSGAGQVWATEQLVVGTVEEQRVRPDLSGNETIIKTYSRLRVHADHRRRDRTAAPSR